MPLRYRHPILLWALLAPLPFAVADDDNDADPGPLARPTAPTPARDEPAAPPHFYQLHIRDGLTVEVSVEAGETGPTGYYELVVSRGDELAARLEGRREGWLEESWLTDLDGDGQFDIVTVERLDDERQSARIRIHEWNDLYLLPVRLQAPTKAQLRGYQGKDDIRVEDDTLLRSFPRYRPGRGKADKQETVTLRYDFEADAWQALEAGGGSWLDVLPFVGDD